MDNTKKEFECAPTMISAPDFHPTLPATPESKAIVGDASWHDIEQSRVQEVGRLFNELGYLQEGSIPPPPSSGMTGRPTLVYEEGSIESDVLHLAEFEARKAVAEVDEMPKWNELDDDLLQAHEKGVMSNDQMTRLLQATGHDVTADELAEAPPATDSLSSQVVPASWSEPEMIEQPEKTKAYDVLLIAIVVVGACLLGLLVFALIA